MLDDSDNGSDNSVNSGGRDDLLREIADKRSRRSVTSRAQSAQVPDNSREALVNEVKDLQTARQAQTQPARDARRTDSAKAVLKRFGVDPLRHLAREFAGIERHDAVKHALALELLPYCYPKLKAVELSGLPTGQVVQIVIGGEHVHAIDTPIEGTAMPLHDNVTDVQSDGRDDA